MYYGARWPRSAPERGYDPALGRFAQADSIVPGGVQGYDRYAYVSNSPVRYTDPTGNRPCNGEFCQEDAGGSSGGGKSGWHKPEKYESPRLSLFLGLTTNVCTNYSCYLSPQPSFDQVPSGGNTPGIGLETQLIQVPITDGYDLNGIFSVDIRIKGGVVFGNTDATYWPTEQGYSNSSLSCHPVECTYTSGLFNGSNNDAYAFSGAAAINGPYITYGEDDYYQRQFHTPIGDITPYGTFGVRISGNWAFPAVVYVAVQTGQYFSQLSDPDPGRIPIPNGIP